jgi:type I restriction enzyme S subunit
MRLKITKLSELIEIDEKKEEKIIKGPLTNPSDREDGTLVHMISIKDLKNGIIKLDPDQKRTLKDSKIPEKSIIKERDVVVSMRGDFRSAIVHSEATEYIINQNLVGLRLNEKILPEVLVVFLNSMKGQQQLTSKSKGMTIPSISVKDLLNIQVPVPPMEIQTILVNYFKSVQEYTSLVHEENELVNKMMDSVISNYLE